MRTKALLLTAALGVAGAATSMAQVYSVNAVGYINVVIPQGFTLIGNQLLQGAGLNKVSDIVGTSVPDQTSYFKFSNGTGYSLDLFDLSGVGGWDPGTITMDHGGGGFLYNPSATPFTVTFVGEVATGTPLMNPVGIGFSALSSKVPQAGRLQADLGYTPVDQEKIYRYDNITGYSLFTYDLSGVGDWDPSDPVLNVGEAVFIDSPSAHPWNRNFSL